MKYSVKTNQGMLGPFSANRIRKLTAAGKLKPEHMILTEEGITIRVAHVIAEAPAPAPANEESETEAEGSADAAAAVEADDVARPTTRKVNRPSTGSTARTQTAAKPKPATGVKAAPGVGVKAAAGKAATAVAEKDEEDADDGEEASANSPDRPTGKVSWFKLLFSMRGLVVFIPLAIAAVLIAGAADATVAVTGSGGEASGVHKGGQMFFLAIGGALGFTGALAVGGSFAVLGIGLFWLLNREPQPTEV